MITFYILNKNSPVSFQEHTCNIIEQEYNNGYKIHVHLATQQEAQNMDDLLWTFKQISFIPHAIYIENSTDFLPQVTIGYNTLFSKNKDVLLNLTSNISDYFLNFKNIIEIIPHNEALKKLARLRYRKYLENNNKIQVINV